MRRFSDRADISKHVSVFSWAVTLDRSAEVEALLRSATMETTGLQMPVTSSRIGLDCFHKCRVNSFMQYFEKFLTIAGKETQKLDCCSEWAAMMIGVGVCRSVSYKGFICRLFGAYSKYMSEMKVNLL